MSNYPNWPQFSPKKCLEIFDKKSADKIQFKNYDEVNLPCLMPIRVNWTEKQSLGYFCQNMSSLKFRLSEKLTKIPHALEIYNSTRPKHEEGFFKYCVFLRKYEL